MAATEFMLGNTALGVRLKDTRTVLRYLVVRGDLDGKRFVLWGDSFAGVNPRGFMLDQSVNQRPGPQAIPQSEPLGSLLAVLTALYEDDVRAVAARGGLVSYMSVLKDRFCYVPLDAIVPGVLETADIADVIAALAPRPVRLASLVDGRNRPLIVSESEEELQSARDAYRGAPSQLVLREEAGDSGVATWIAGQLAR